jgi:hypothetical protein
MDKIKLLLKYNYVIENFLYHGDKLKAFRFIKDITNFDLKTSKFIVDNYNDLERLISEIIEE